MLQVSLESSSTTGPRAKDLSLWNQMVCIHCYIYTELTTKYIVVIAIICFSQRDSLKGERFGSLEAHPDPGSKRGS